MRLHVVRAVDLSEIAGVDNDIAASTSDSRTLDSSTISQTDDVGADIDGAARRIAAGTCTDHAPIDANPFGRFDNNISAMLTYGMPFDSRIRQWMRVSTWEILGYGQVA